MTTVACVGLAVQDVILSVDELPSGPGKSFASGRAEVGGGPAANAAVAIVALGDQARLFSVLGDDRLGDVILDELRRRRVETGHIRRLPGQMSPLSSVVVDQSGERRIVNHTDSRLFEDAELPGSEELYGVDAVLVDVRWALGAGAALEWARDHDIPGVVDFDLGAADPDSLLEAASHVIFSKEGLRSLTGNDDIGEGLEAVRSRCAAWLAVTTGGSGTVWLEGGVPRSVSAFDIDVVDTTGAGDVYHGVFTLELARGLGEEDAMESASAAAALSCTRVGGREGVPSREQLNRFLLEHR